MSQKSRTTTAPLVKPVAGQQIFFDNARFIVTEIVNPEHRRFPSQIMLVNPQEIRYIDYKTFTGVTHLGMADEFAFNLCQTLVHMAHVLDDLDNQLMNKRASK